MINMDFFKSVNTADLFLSINPSLQAGGIIASTILGFSPDEQAKL